MTEFEWVNDFGSLVERSQAEEPVSTLLPPEGAESTENFSNRMFPLEQGHVQDAVDKLFENWSEVTETGYTLEKMALGPEPEPEKAEPEKSTPRRLRFGPATSDGTKNNE